MWPPCAHLAEQDQPTVPRVELNSREMREAYNADDRRRAVTANPSQPGHEGLPAWADATLSADLPDLRARGESQTLEYIREFPQNVRELAKEIAAFATSNAGMVLLGVDDEGELVGLPGAGTLEGRDSLLKRVGGVCHGTVMPAIRAAALFAVEDDRTVLVLSIPKGTQPVYYSHGVPYLRHLTESRRAEPHEVVELVRAWLPTAPSEGDSEAAAFLSRLAAVLIDVIIYGEESEERGLNPWLDLRRAQYGQDAVQLRELASSEEAQRQAIGRSLFDLAQALDDVADFQLYLGETELDSLTSTALDQAKRLKADLIEPHPLSEQAVREARKTITATSRMLGDLVQRMQAIAEEGRVEEIQAEASRLGLALLRIGHYSINQLREGLDGLLRQIGRQLHLVETIEVCMDGGYSMNLILQTVQESYDQLVSLLAASPAIG